MQPYLLLNFLTKNTIEFKISSRYKERERHGHNRITKTLYVFSKVTFLEDCLKAGRISGGPSSNCSAGGCI